MEGSPIFLFERELLSKCMGQTILLIHCTKVMAAIKRLTKAYDILELNSEIEKSFARSIKDEFFWDVASLQDLKLIKQELVVYHQADFDPYEEFRKYSYNIEALVRNVQFRYEQLK